MQRIKLIRPNPSNLPHLNQVNAVIVDGRGTILDSHQDMEINFDLCQEIVNILTAKIPVAIITGSSLDTLESLVLSPINKLINSIVTTNNEIDLYLYTESGSLAHIVTLGKPCISIVPMPNYKRLILSAGSKINIQQKVSEIFKEFGCASDIQLRSGQINCYISTSDRSIRLAIAQKIKMILNSEDLPRLVVRVPTSKDVIDISLASKSRAVTDFVTRLRINDLPNIVAISDSFQSDGADVEILQAVDYQCNAFHVGGGSVPLAPNVINWPGGCDATKEILSLLIPTFNSSCSEINFTR